MEPVAAKIVKKDGTMFELIVQVDRVIDTWKNNRAQNAKSIEGKQMMLAGFWRRKDQYHGLKVGDHIEVGLQHIGLRSDHLTVAEFVRKSTRRPETPKPTASKGTTSHTEIAQWHNRFHGFTRGTARGKRCREGYVGAQR